jgi:poly(3-hydroxybutyrate) depolymerase
MKIFTSYALNSICFLIILCFYTENALSQQTGSFDKQITQGTFTGQVSFYVPPSGVPTEGFPLIIGLHPAQTPGTAMKDMMLSAAETLGAVLACPEGADGDGTAIMPVIEWVKKTYEIDDKKVFLTGYSAGGSPAIKTGLANVNKFKGVIGIAPSVSTFDVSNNFVSLIAIAMIIGKDDPLYSNIRSVIATINQNGGTSKLVEKPGVAHTGLYYWSPEFAADWIECYNFCISSVLKPAIVNLLKPNNGALDQPTSVNLSWEKAVNFTSYKIEISTSAGIYKSDNVTTESYSLPELAKNTKYSWKVCAVNSSGAGPWSEEWSFTTLNDAPADAVVLLEPVNNADLKGPDLLFKWETVPNATKYHFQIFEDVSDIMFAQDSSITSTSNYAQFNVTKLKAGVKYKWHVRAYNKYGTTPWSEVWKFTTIPNPPTAKSILQQPADNATNQSVNIKFKWTLVTNADNYHLQVKNMKDNTYFYDDSTIAKPASGSYVEVYVNGLSPETQYSWKIRGLNRGGAGPWSNEFTLTTAPSTAVYETIPSVFKTAVYPTPSNGYVVLSFTLPKDGISQIEIFNAIGVRLDIPFESIYSSGEYNLPLNLIDYPNGAYYVKIISDNKAEIKGFMIFK